MPIITITGLITSQQLRDEIGGPTLDTAEAGHIQDYMLQGIIDRWAEWLRQIAEPRLMELMANGTLEMLPDYLNFTEVSLSPSSDHPLLAEGEIDEDYFPYATQAFDDEGKPYSYDPHILITAFASPVARRRFCFKEYRAMALPSTLETLRVWVYRYADIYQAVVPDLLAQANERIKAEARQMLADRIAEGTRLKELGEIDD